MVSALNARKDFILNSMTNFRIRNKEGLTDDKPTMLMALPNYWFFGWLVQREMSKMLTLGTELFSQTRITEDGKARTGFTLGAILNITDDHHLLFSGGRGIHGENRFSAYVAYQYTFGPHEGKK